MNKVRRLFVSICYYEFYTYLSFINVSCILHEQEFLGNLYFLVLNLFGYWSVIFLTSEGKQNNRRISKIKKIKIT